MSPLRPKPSLRLSGKGFDITPEDAAILDAIRQTHSLTAAAKKLGVSYKHLWSSVRDAEAGLGRRLVISEHGGRGGGGRARLTDYGSRLLREYARMSGGLADVVKQDSFWEAIGLKLSIRNRLPGIVREVTRDRASAHVVIDVKSPTKITALVTREAVDDLGIEVGDRVEALVKSTEVMLAKRG